MLAKLNIGKVDAFKLYLLLSGVESFALTMAFTVNLVYQVNQVGLNPLQLVLIGTCLEVTAFTMEIPTGIVADIYSRRLSVILGFVLLGLGFVVEGSFPVFEVLLVAQIIMGVGYTFLSGAKSAWIVDEIGQQRAGSAFLRSSQVAQVSGFVAIFVSVALASASLQLAIVCAGIILLLLVWSAGTGHARRRIHANKQIGTRILDRIIWRLSQGIEPCTWQTSADANHASYDHPRRVQRGVRSLVDSAFARQLYLASPWATR